MEQLLTVLKVQADNAIDGFAKAQKAAEGFERSISKLGTTLQGIGQKLTIALTVPIAGFIGAAVSARADMQKLEMGLNAVTGSAEETAKQLERLKEIAKLPGLSLEDATRASINLQAVGVNAAKSERYIMAFGNALAVVGKGAPDLNPVITQLVQMSTKSKVVASDLKPIMEAVPQVAAIVKREFGTIDTEALQKMGVSTEEFTDKVLKGLEKLPKAGNGIANQFENLKDTIKNNFAELGKSLEPLIMRVLSLLNGLADKASEAVDWFKGLSDTQKGFIVTVAALVAAVGPLLYVMGALVSVGGTVAAGFGLITSSLKVVSSGIVFLQASISTLLSGGLSGLSAVVGGITLPMLAWGAAISAVTVVLVRLGTWIADNWNPILAVSQQAVQAVLEAMGVEWPKAMDLLQKAWNGLASTVGSVVGWIKNAFMSLGGVFDWMIQKAFAILKAYAETVEFVSGGKIKLDKLKTLQKTWDDTKRSIDAAGKAADATFAKATQKPTNDQPATFERTATGKKDKAKKDYEFFDFSKAFSPDALAKAIDTNIKAQASKLLGDIAKAALEAKKPVQEFGKGFEDLANTTTAALVPALNSIHTPLASITTSMTDYGAAIERLGIKTTASLEATAKSAEKDYYTIADGIGTVDEIKQAYVKWTEAVIALKLARGEDVTALQKDLKLVQDSLTGTVQKTAQKTREPLKEVSTILTNLNQDIASAIVNWRGFGGVAMSVIKSVGKAIISDILGSFLLTEERMNAVKTTLGSLLGKIPGLDNVFTKASNTIIKNTTDAAGAVASTAKTTVSNVGKVASGAVSSAIGAVTGVVSAVTGVIGVFQAASQGKDIARIEVTTRGLLNQSISIQNTLNQYLPWLQTLGQTVNQMVATGLGVYSPTQTEVRARILGNTLASGSGSGAAIQMTVGNVYGGPAGLTDLAKELITVMRLQGAKI